MPVHFVPNPGFEHELLASPALAHDLLEPLVAEGAEGAKRHAPVRLGHLRDSVKGIVGIEHERYIGRILDTDFKAHWWEFGYRSHPHGHPYLRPAVAELLPGAPIEGGGGQ